MPSEAFSQEDTLQGYDELFAVNYNTFIARKDSLWGVVVGDNVIKFPFEYKSIIFDKDVYKYIFKEKNGKLGFVDVIFEKIIAPVYDSITIFKTSNNRYLKCWKEGTSSIYNRQS